MSKSVLYDTCDVPYVPASDTYLTDETHLYRVLGLSDGTQTLLTVEDCHTLDVIVVEAEKAADLRHVTPAEARAT